MNANHVQFDAYDFNPLRDEQIIIVKVDGVTVLTVSSKDSPSIAPDVKSTFAWALELLKVAP